MHNCIFCQIAHNKIASSKLFENEFCYLIKDAYPKSSQHFLLIPNLHMDNLLAPTASQLMQKMINILPQISELCGFTDGFRMTINTGPGGGQEINHLHLHLQAGQYF